MRHEEKFICSEKQLRLLEQRIRAVVPRDAHQEGESYHIRSLYLDTYDDRLYQESLNGVDRRNKYRIRFYNMDNVLFKVERKYTEKNLKQKSSAKVGVEFVKKILSGDIDPPGDDGVLGDVYAMYRSEGLKPVTIVDYQRSAYTYPIGNVRITFDRDIACTLQTEGFLDPHALLIPVMPEGKHILEVKYDGIFPGYLAKLLDIGSLEQVSFSKYAYARNVMEYNGRKEEGYEF